jgi:hypothetical protein
MRIQAHAAIALCTLALAACKSETKTDTTNTTIDSTAAAATAPAPAPSPTTPAPPPGPVTAKLDTKNSSGVTGDATATHAQDSVTIELKLNGLKKGVKYTAHIHSGTCAAGGPVVVPLTAPDPSGMSRTTVAVASLASAGQQMFIQAHGAKDAPVACGDLPGHGAPPSDTVKTPASMTTAG